MTLHFDNIFFKYGLRKPWVLDGFSLKIDRPGIYGLLGPNGAGKSTLLYLAMGALQANRGSVTFDGTATRLRRPDTLAQMFLVPEDTVLPAMRLDDFVSAYAPLYPAFSHEIMQRCLQMFDFPEGNPVLTSLSMGQKKKAYISFAVACRTPLLLMDEPTNGLDIESKAAFRRIVASVVPEDTVTVISTHQVRDLDRLLDHIIIMNSHRVVLDAPVHRLQQTFRFADNVDVAEAAGALFSIPTAAGVSAVFAAGADDTGPTDINLELLYNYAVKQPGDLPAMPADDDCPGVAPHAKDPEEPAPDTPRANAHCHGPGGGARQRFARYMRLYLVSNRRMLLLLCAAAVAGMTLVALMPYLFDGFRVYARGEAYFDQYPGDPVNDRLLPLYWMLLAGWATLAGTQMYGAMHKKANRLLALTAPASRAQKALAWYLLWGIGFVAVFFAAMYIAEAVRLAFVHVFCPFDGVKNAAVMPLSKFVSVGSAGEGRPQVLLALALGWGTVMCLQAVYALGSIYFTRLSWLCTSAALFTLQTACTVIAVVTINIAFGNGVQTRYEDWHLFRLHPSAMGACTAIAAVTVYAVLQALAFARFKQTENTDRW